MAESLFVKQEILSAKTGLIALNRRLFGQLSWFLRLLPVSLVTILVSSAGPSVFRWYSGKVLSSSPGFTVSGLIWVVALAILIRIAAWAFFEISGMWSSQTLHAQMVRALAAVRTTYFDENPSGRLINRLVRDFHEVYSTAIIFSGDFLNAGVEVISIAVVACLASPWAGFMILPLLGIFYWIQYQRSAMLEHSRGLAALATSQVISRQTDLIEGREIFLLYGRENQLLERMLCSFQETVRATALTQRIEVWTSFWIRFSGEIFSLFVLFFMVDAVWKGRMDRTLAGVMISSLFGITGSLGWLDFASGQVSRSAPHLRRVFELIDLPKEEDEEREKTTNKSLGPRVMSPVAGDIVFEDFTMSYRSDTPIILDHFNLQIPLGSHLALIGRTGSGKTSVMQSLLRMVYVHRGDIQIGGKSIYPFDVYELRRLFGVVPQFPYLFAGTLRSNLDRTGVLVDSQLAAALNAVQLEYSLDHRVLEGGQNFSLGERQLLCLARVIASDRRLILMDEPTSGLDPVTDARITQVLRTALQGKTLLTIAHRRESLGNYDRVIMMGSA